MHQYNLLIVEDEKNFCEQLTTFFRKTNYRIDTAEGKEEALQQWEKNIYDVILVDIQLPEGFDAGIQFIEEIRKRQLLTQIIIISAYEDEAAFYAKALEKKVYCYIGKGDIDKNVVLKAVSEAIKDRDSLLISAESLAKEDPDETIFYRGKKAITAQKLYDSLRRGDEFGRKYYQGYRDSLWITRASTEQSDLPETDDLFEETT